MTPIDPKGILAVLDHACESFTFPMLDNGYVYLAATRLSLFRSDIDWAMVIEVFGFSPRAGHPDINIHTFASRMPEANPPEEWEFRFVYPLEEGPWQDAEICEYLADDAEHLLVRGRSVRIPSREEYKPHGISLEDPDRVRVFELARFLAATQRDDVLATRQERRASVRPEMSEILLLDEWHHPNVVEGERPSGSDTFRQLADVLSTGDAGRYKPSRPSNTHWRHWPDGGHL